MPIANRDLLERQLQACGELIVDAAREGDAAKVAVLLRARTELLSELYGEAPDAEWLETLAAHERPER